MDTDTATKAQGPEAQAQFEIPFTLMEELRLTQRQKALLYAVRAGFTPDQISALRSLFEAEAAEVEPTRELQRTAEELQHRCAELERQEGDRPPALIVGLAGALIGFLGGAWLVAAVTPKPPPSLKARFANWLLSEL